MAQIDTHLGWLAESDWLRYNATTLLADIGGLKTSLDGSQPLPQIETPEEVYSKGTLIASRGAGTFVYYAACSIGTEGIVYISPDQDNYLHFMTTNRDFILYVGVVSRGTPGAVSEYTGTSYSPNYQIYGYISNKPIYYSPAFAIYIHQSEIVNIPNVTDSAMFDSLTLDSFQIQKVNQGYAVACIAKWKTSAAVFTTPVLISSDSDIVEMAQVGGGAYNFAKLNILYGGVRFYMSFWDISDGPSITSTLPVYDMTGDDDPAMTLEEVFRGIASYDYGHISIYDAPDPYEETAEEEGGDGDDPEDDPVEEQTNPLPSVAGLGFCAIYVPSQSELLAMASYLWSGSFDVEQVIKLFSNPLDSILGLSAVPVDLVGTSEQISLGGVALTGVTMPRYTGRTAVKVDMGTVTIGERYGAYLDYDPYTEFAIYVPFVGIKNLKADDIMGKTLSLMYDIDILTGACVAYLRPAGGSVLYEWAGQCAQQIPVTSSNWDNIFRNAVTAASTLGTSLFAPASAPVLAGAVASAAAQAIAAKPRVDRSGALTGVSGWLGQLRPYIIRTIPEAYIPTDQNKFIGYPAYITVSMSEISGYNEVASVHLEGIPATGNELAEIESLLKGGVIF